MEKQGKVLAIAVGFVMVLIILVAVALAYAGRDVSLLKDRTLHIAVNGYSMEIPLSEDGATFDVPSLRVGNDNEFILINDAGANIEVDGAKLRTNRRTRVNVEKISESEVLELTVASGKDTRTLYLRTRSTLLPEMIATGQGEGGGEYYVTAQDAPIVYRLDEGGNINWYIALSEEQANGQIFTDFEKTTLDNNRVRYSYQMVNADAPRWGISDYYPGTRMILDEEFTEVDRDGARLSLLDDSAETLDPDVMGEPVDGHAFELLGNNHWLTASYEVASVDNVPDNLNPPANGAKVVGCVIQEVEDGEPVFTWRSTDYPELYALSTAGNNYAGSTASPQDYLHLVDMAVDPSDNNIVLAFKNANTIVKIDRESGDILWMLSGNSDDFGLSDAQKTTSIASIDMGENGELTVMDGNRVLTYTLDEENHKLSDFKAYSLSGYSAQGGSAQKIGESTYVISWGACDGSQPAVTEIDFSNNDVHFELVLPNGEGTWRVQKA